MPVLGKTDVLDQLREANKKRCPEFGHEIDDWTPPEWSNAVCGEAGELANVIKKLHRGDYTLKELQENEMIANEAADIVIYLDMFCQRVGINLKNALVNKFNEKSKEIGSKVTIYYY